MFRYNNINITLENYGKVFNGVSPDILDEIRSAILDDTPIGKYINLYIEDDFTLGQIRKAIREYVPIEYLNAKLPGTVLKNVRLGLKKGYDMAYILDYANDKGLLLDAESLEIISNFMAIGINVSGVDFKKVPKSQVALYCKGLSYHYPMWLLLDSNLTDEKLELMMRGMQLGIDIHPFLSNDWNDSVIVTLFSNHTKIDINAFLELISPRFNNEEIKILIGLYKDNLPIEPLCVKDTDGNPVYNIYQMDALAEATRQDLLTSQMLNPSYSDMDLYEMIKAEKKERNRKLSVSFNKNT